MPFLSLSPHELNPHLFIDDGCTILPKIYRFCAPSARRHSFLHIVGNCFHVCAMGARPWPCHRSNMPFLPPPQFSDRGSVDVEWEKVLFLPHSNPSLCQSSLSVSASASLGPQSLFRKNIWQAIFIQPFLLIIQLFFWIDFYG